MLCVSPASLSALPAPAPAAAAATASASSTTVTTRKRNRRARRRGRGGARARRAAAQDPTVEGGDDSPAHWWLYAPHPKGHDGVEIALGDAGFPVVLPSGQDVFLLPDAVHPYAASTFLAREVHDKYASQVQADASSSSSSSSSSSTSSFDDEDLITETDDDDDMSDVSSLSSASSACHDDNIITNEDCPAVDSLLFGSASGVWATSDDVPAGPYWANSTGSVASAFSSSSLSMSSSSWSSCSFSAATVSRFFHDDGEAEDEAKVDEDVVANVEAILAEEEPQDTDDEVTTVDTPMSKAATKATKKIMKTAQREEEEKARKLERRAKQEARARKNAAKQQRRAERRATDEAPKLDEIDAALLELEFMQQ